MRISTLQRLGLIALTGLAVSACQFSKKSNVSVDYYQIQGDSVETLDQQIRTKGPRLDNGVHAVAVARIRMIPNFKFKSSDGRCRVSSAKVNVDAKVTLPSWKGRKTAGKKLGAAWDNIDRYTRLHEAYHVSVAFKHAKWIEKAVLAQEPATTCFAMRRQTYALFQERLKDHEAEQQQFDRDEQKRISELAKKQKAKSLTQTKL